MNHLILKNNCWQAQGTILWACNHYLLNLLISVNRSSYLRSKDITMDPSEIKPVEVFAGSAWEVGLVRSLLENAEITVYIYYGGKGTLAPWDSGGGTPINRIIVSMEDYDKAREVVDQYFKALKK